MTDPTTEEILHAAARRQVIRMRSDQIWSHYHQCDITTEATALIEGGLLRKVDGFRYYLPTEAASKVYTGDDKCPHCGEFERTEWLGEDRRGTNNGWRCYACKRRWYTPTRNA